MSMSWGPGSGCHSSWFPTFKRKKEQDLQQTDSDLCCLAFDFLLSTFEFQFTWGSEKHVELSPWLCLHKCILYIQLWHWRGRLWGREDDPAHKSCQSSEDVCKCLKQISNAAWTSLCFRNHLSDIFTVSKHGSVSSWLTWVFGSLQPSCTGSKTWTSLFHPQKTSSTWAQIKRG